MLAWARTIRVLVSQAPTFVTHAGQAILLVLVTKAILSWTNR